MKTRMLTFSVSSQLALTVVGLTLSAVMAVCIGRLAHKKMENLVAVTETGEDAGAQVDSRVKGAAHQVGGEGEMGGTSGEGRASIQVEP